MKLQYENQSRKVDNLGRVTIPKPIRDRLGWENNCEVEFYVMDDNFIVMSRGKMRDNRYDIAIELLEELGLSVPERLKEGPKL